MYSSVLEPNFIIPNFSPASQFLSGIYLAYDSPGNCTTDLPENHPVFGAVYSGHFDVVGLINAPGLRVHCVLVFTRLIGDFLDLCIARCAINMGIENTKKYSDSQRGAADKVIFLDDFDIGYSAVGRCEQEIFIRQARLVPGRGKTIEPKSTQRQGLFL